MKTIATLLGCLFGLTVVNAQAQAQAQGQGQGQGQGQAQGQAQAQGQMQAQAQAQPQPQAQGQAAVPTAAQKKRPSSEIPMYGNPNKPINLNKRDAAFIASLEKSGHTRQEVAKDMMFEGWKAFQKGDRNLAIRKFNQAWLLDQENANAYHGFALISWMRDSAIADAEKFFRMALSKAGVNVDAHVDFGRFLFSEKRYDESIAALKKAIEITPDVRGARANLSLGYALKEDYAKACEWAKNATEKKETLPGGHLEDMCKRSNQNVKMSG